MISRLLTSTLLKSINFFPVTGIIGPRQVGKTTLAKSLINNLEKEVIYLDLENPRDLSKIEDPVLFFTNNRSKCIILDEIQQEPQLFPVLRSMVDDNRVPGRFILLGSASPNIIRNSSESLAGRISYKELTPILLNEATEVKNNYHNHWLRGGFPDAYLAPGTELSFNWHANFIKTYEERDLPMLGLAIDRLTIHKLWTMMAHLNGNLLNMSTLAKSLSTNAVSIKNYISYLEGAFLIRLLPSFSINTKKRLVKSPKVYIRDSGIYNQLMNISSWEDMESHPMLGHSWEAYAIEQIISNGKNNVEHYFYRTQDGSECDLVLVKSNIPIVAIEIKYTSSPKTSKGLLQSFKDLKTDENFIITPSTDDYMLTKNIRVCDLFTFLTTYLVSV